MLHTMEKCFWIYKWNGKLHVKTLSRTSKQNILLVLVFFPLIYIIKKTIAKQVYSLCPPQLNGRKTLYFVLSHVFC